MGVIHDRLSDKIPALRQERAEILAQYGDSKVSEISVRQLHAGMRGVNALFCDTSVVDPDKGLLIRGIPVIHLADKLPEEVLFLLLTGELPDANELRGVRDDLTGRAKTPGHLRPLLEAMPKNSHPMTMLSAAIVSMERDSKFRNAFEAGRGREDLWTAALDDSLDLIAALPSIAAGIYRMRYEKGPPIQHDGSLHWAANLARMLGNDGAEFAECLRLAAVVQSDHEGGHASALTAQTVGSTLSSIYYAYAAAINALAGPNHGLAGQVCVEWVIGAVDTYGGVPSDEQIREYTLGTLAEGRRIPGYGHAVLRGQDPRYLAMLAFGEKHCARSDLFRTVVKMSRVVPAILIEQGKAQNPWPNVDAINGSIYYAFGITEVPFYTVLFAVALSLGITAQYVLNRALGTPIIRPRSVTTEWVRKRFGEGG